MIQRTPPLRRKTPLKRSGPIKRIPSITQKRRSERAKYAKLREQYLDEHPFCMVFIARNGIDEREVLRDYSGSVGSVFYKGKPIPRATQVHHRNKNRGPLLNDQRWWIACCAVEHDWIENNKSTARLLGFLLPIQANAEGEWGDGNKAQTTPEMMALFYK